MGQYDGVNRQDYLVCTHYNPTMATLKNGMGELHEGLKSEIEFWQDLIIESGLSIHSIECKRMEHAMLFAQMKLWKHEHELVKSVNKLSKH